MHLQTQESRDFYVLMYKMSSQMKLYFFYIASVLMSRKQQ